MIANKKYTAIEILTEAGIEKPEEKIGKMRVRIGGIAGIVKPGHIIRIPAGTKEVSVIVGQETATIPVGDDSEDAAVSEGAQKAIEAKGAEATENAEAIAKAKAQAKKPVK
jgi:hypothetical protein